MNWWLLDAGDCPLCDWSIIDVVVSSCPLPKVVLSGGILSYEGCLVFLAAAPRISDAF